MKNEKSTLEKLKATTKQLTTLRRLREKLIVQARTEGKPLRTIAAAAGVTHQTIVNIITRSKTRNP